MIITPLISHEAKLHIQNKLQQVAKEQDVQILLAVESGSRAWGFPSKDSDYDVRFIYVRKKNTYLSVKNYRDVIEVPVLYDEVLGVPFDLNGWDIRKALQLALKSNPVLIEWLVSPVCYMSDFNIITKIKTFAQKIANLHTFCYHYHNVAKNSWQQIQESPEQVRLKLYCYALRPILVLQWMLIHQQTPPMHMQALCNGVNADHKLLEEIKDLINKKLIANEKDLIKRNFILDSYISHILENKAGYSKEILENTEFIEQADNLFRDIVFKST
ncbi:nucleotidyltransferase domain-containing protein [Candidatus Phycorickettsia trachydisci]|nr:nucleotidyltransferase domain-containing protein [Candidatus Phycorickettsia trachydisci]